MNKQKALNNETTVLPLFVIKLVVLQERPLVCNFCNKEFIPALPGESMKCKCGHTYESATE